jgi:hypothetical protein
LDWTFAVGVSAWAPGDGEHVQSGELTEALLRQKLLLFQLIPSEDERTYGGKLTERREGDPKAATRRQCARFAAILRLSIQQKWLRKS